MVYRIENFEIWTFFSHNYSAIQYQVTQKRHGWYKDLQNNFSANVKGLLSYFTHFCECQTTEPSHRQALCPGLHWTPLKQGLHEKTHLPLFHHFNMTSIFLVIIILELACLSGREAATYTSIIAESKSYKMSYELKSEPYFTLQLVI